MTSLRAALALVLALAPACAADGAMDGGGGGGGGKADDVDGRAEMPDPNADEAPAADWAPPPIEQWPDAYPIFNNTGCGRDCDRADQDALRSRSVMVKMIIAAIDSVEEGGTVRVANFNISSSASVTPVADALLRALDRGVTVKIAADSEQDTGSSRTNQLADAGAQVRFARGLRFESSVDGSEQFGILHSKMVIADDRVLLTGSNNFSSSGFVTNEENSVVLRDTAHAALIDAFVCDFEGMFGAGVQAGQPQRDDSDPERRASIATLDGCMTGDTWFPPAGMLTTGKSPTFGAIAGGIGAADASVDLAPDMLAHPGVVSSLLARARRAVEDGEPFQVRVVLDASPEALGNPAFGQCLDDAAAAEQLPIEVRYWAGNDEIFQLLHHKTMIIDADTDAPVVFNGSANFSTKAFKNSFENVVRYRGEAFRGLAAHFAARFERMFGDALDRDSFAAETGGEIPACPIPEL